MQLQGPLIVLITGFLGTPKTASSVLKNEEVRYISTLSALSQIRRATGARILFAGTGNRDSLKRLLDESNWNIEDAAWFPQEIELTKFGKGRLEHQLITNAIQHWNLSEYNARVIKITAKYVVENLENVLESASESRHPLFGWRHINKPWIDSRCFHFLAKSYPEFEFELHQIDDRKGYYMEQALFEAMVRIGVRPGWIRNRPIVSGLSGSSGIHSRPSLIKRWLVGAASMGPPIR